MVYNYYHFELSSGTDPLILGYKSSVFPVKLAELGGGRLIRPNESFTVILRCNFIDYYPFKEECLTKCFVFAFSPMFVPAKGFQPLIFPL